MVLLAAVLQAAGPRLGMPAVTSGMVTLPLTGGAAVSYRLEASTNLTVWFPVASGRTAADGTLTLQHDSSRLGAWVAYRAVEGTVAAPYPTVQPMADTNRTATAVVVPDQEALLQLETPDGIRWSVRFPTNAFTEPTLVRLTGLLRVDGFPAQAGMLAAVQVEPPRAMPLSPVFVEIEFPGSHDPRRISSVAFDVTGEGLHLVPDVVSTTGGRTRVRMLATQLRSYACGMFSLDELESLAATTPPVRLRGRNATLHATLEECYPDEARAAREMQEDLEDKIRPLQQAAAATLGRERQMALLGADEGEGAAALARVMDSADAFYATEVEPRIAGAVRSCAAATTLVPWVLGHERQRALMGGGGTSATAGMATLLCEGARRCQEQIEQCCRDRGGDTRLLQSLLGIERQRELLGAGAACGSVSVEQAIQACAPEWYGTLTVQLRGRYHDLTTNGPWRVHRTAAVDQVLTATVLSTKVKRNSASIFAPAYTNITCVLGGPLVASDQSQKVEESLDTVCQGRPHEKREDRWASTLSTHLSDVSLEAVILDPGAGSLFVVPYLRVLGDGPRDMRWSWFTQRNRPSEFDDESCVTEQESGGTYEPDGGDFDASFSARQGEFTYTADSIRYAYEGAEEMQFDFAHSFQGAKRIQLDLHRVR